MQIPKQKLFLFEAKRWIGTKEVGGDNKGQLVEMFQKAVDGKAQGEPWCMAFVQFCAQATDLLGLEVFGEAGKCILPKTEHCMTLWNGVPAAHKLVSPEPGCLVIWQFYKGGKATPSGHVGIVKEILADGSLVTIEGNTADGSGIVREGNGVYERKRSAKGSADMKVVGFVKVW